MQTNPSDAFKGHSRSPNTVPFDMLGMVSYYCAIVSLSVTCSIFFRYPTSKSVVTLKSASKVTQDH